jgi:transposase
MQILELNSPEEIKKKIQQYFRKNEEAKFIHRLHGILLKIENKDNACETIAELFGQSARTISNWINKVNETGDIEILRDRVKPGRNSKLNDEQLVEIKSVLQNPPELSGVSANIWDGKSLSFYIEREFKIELGVRQCQRLFKNLGFSLKRARPIVSKGDASKKEVSKKTSRISKKQ